MAGEPAAGAMLGAWVVTSDPAGAKKHMLVAWEAPCRSKNNLVSERGGVLHYCILRIRYRQIVGLEKYVNRLAIIPAIA